MLKKNGGTVALAGSYRALNDLLKIGLSQEEFSTVWMATSGEDALRQGAEHPPDVIIFRMALDDMTAIEGIRKAHQLIPQVRILAFIPALSPQIVQDLIDAGATGIVTESSPFQSLLTAIHVLMDGGCYFDSSVTPYLHSPRSAGSALGEREKMILRLVAEGFSTKEIAGQLEISFKTVEKIREHIMAKLNLHDAVRLTRYALGAGISFLRPNDTPGTTTEKDGRKAFPDRGRNGCATEEARDPAKGRRMANPRT